MPQIRHVKIYPSTTNFQLTNTDVVPVSQALAYIASITKSMPTAEIRGWGSLTIQADVEISDLQLMQEKVDLLRSLLVEGASKGFTPDEVKQIISNLQ